MGAGRWFRRVQPCVIYCSDIPRTRIQATPSHPLPTGRGSYRLKHRRWTPGWGDADAFKGRGHTSAFTAQHIATARKRTNALGDWVFGGGPSGIRTPDRRIKSPLLRSQLRLHPRTRAARTGNEREEVTHLDTDRLLREIRCCAAVDSLSSAVRGRRPFFPRGTTANSMGDLAVSSPKAGTARPDGPSDVPRTTSGPGRLRSRHKRRPRSAYGQGQRAYEAQCSPYSSYV